jgi:hypothetical protein
VRSVKHAAYMHSIVCIAVWEGDLNDEMDDWSSSSDKATAGDDP